MNDLLNSYLISTAITPNKIIAAVVVLVIIVIVAGYFLMRGRSTT